MKQISRRNVLQRGAVSLALPYLVTRLETTRASTAPSKKLTMGAIGLGNQGLHNLKSFLTCEDLRVLAVCDVDAGHLLRAKQTVDVAYGNQDCCSYRDFYEILEKAIDRCREAGVVIYQIVLKNG